MQSLQGSPFLKKPPEKRSPQNKWMTTQKGQGLRNQQKEAMSIPTVSVNPGLENMVYTQQAAKISKKQEQRMNW